MERSKVYFTDFRTKLGEGLPSKLKRLIRAAGIEQIDMENKLVAIKMHYLMSFKMSETDKYIRVHDSTTDFSFFYVFSSLYRRYII